MRSEETGRCDIRIPDVDLEARGKSLTSLVATTIAPELSLEVMLWDVCMGVFPMTS